MSRQNVILFFAFAITFIGVTFNNFCFAQYRKFEFGGRIGMSFTSLMTSEQIYPGNVGLSVGGLIDYPLNAVIKFQVNVDYHQLSGTTSNAGIRDDGTNVNTPFIRHDRVSVHLAEISGSVMYRVPVGFFGTDRPFVLLGGSGGYNLSSICESKITNLTSPSFSTYSQKVITDSVSKYLYALHAGIHFEWAIDNSIFSAFLIDFRYQRNINSISEGHFLKSNDPSLFSADDIKAHSLITTIGFKF